jgi:cytochrome c553
MPERMVSFKKTHACQRLLVPVGAFQNFEEKIVKETLSMGVLIVLLCESAALGQTVDPRIASGRTLATNCMQCHGVNGMPKSSGFDSLVGKSYSEIKKELLEMKAKTGSIEADEELMVVHAKSYTDTEIDAMAYFLSRP